MGDQEVGALCSQIPLGIYDDQRVLTAAEACHGAGPVPGQCPGCHCLPFMKMKSSNDSSGCVCLSGQLRAGVGCRGKASSG